MPLIVERQGRDECMLATITAPRMLDLVRDIARSERPLSEYAIEARSILLFLENHNA